MVSGRTCSPILQVVSFCMILAHSWLCSIPISKLLQLVYKTQQDIEHAGILNFVIGHAGDGDQLTRHHATILTNEVSTIREFSYAFDFQDG